ncbi:hypothetical protein Ddye_025105 [Dipteronia dyeriana]|uniref:Uncharacterized protein n=1 Tax=Dipteronia dyeriana TaxID=168575 RepID=A0AAD9TW92_9ROSI|nr:hypothetical protein Ddye_025105 [Dipteronia dyeriana]
MLFSRPMKKSRCWASMAMTEKPKRASETDVSYGGRLANAILSGGDDDHARCLADELELPIPLNDGLDWGF